MYDTLPRTRPDINHLKYIFFIYLYPRTEIETKGFTFSISKSSSPSQRTKVLLLSLVSIFSGSPSQLVEWI
ncbi:hypothetical protein Lalb_Chr12g0207771 [Lupinus albus]|uniref:Uncharacterized protein n=1 Tax=Lupinus albus TaxID=3870 RepID=A0A6A4PNX7_LUPAL|nr:hypothetical protein Lalb_Chr12g0207771 [Lupinus albus]